MNNTSYPWFRVLAGCLMGILCLTIPVYREHKTEISHWWFAKLWSHFSEHSAIRVNPYRQPLLAHIQRAPRVLEIGPGYGDYLRLLDKHTIQRYVAVEPNCHLHDKLLANAQASGLGAQIVVVNGTLDSAAVPEQVQQNAPYDVVVSWLCLCSVADVGQNLEHIRGLLKTGGKFVFLEHIRHREQGRWQQVQDWMTPVWSALSGNCHMDRQTDAAIQQAFSKVQMEHVKQDQGILDHLTPFVYGVATKQ